MCQEQKTDNELLEMVRQADRAMDKYEFERAEDLYLRAYNFGVSIYGADHGAVGLALLRLSKVAHITGRFELAQSYASEASRIADLYLERF